MTVQPVSEHQIETDRAVIEAELQRLLKQKRFSAASQMSAFLKYIVTQTLDGNGDRIKAYTVGVDALGKPESFDAQNDPSVRVLALRLRKCLNASYEQDCGLQHARIVLKVGTYVPEFLKTEHDQRTDGRQRSSMGSSDAESETAIAPVVEATPADLPQARQHLQMGGLDRPVGSSAFHDETPDGVGDSATSDSPNARSSATSWLVSGLLLLVVAGLTLNGSSDGRFGVHGAVSVHDIQLASVLPHAPKGETTTAVQDRGALHEAVPTLYVPDSKTQSLQLRQVVTLLGSSVVERGNVDVVRVSLAVGAAQPSVQGVTGVDGGIGYWMMMDEIHLDSQPTLILQLLRQDSGAVLMSKTLTLNSAATGFSREEVRRIEALANDISSTTGPLFGDYCTNKVLQATNQCRQSTDS